MALRAEPSNGPQTARLNRGLPAVLRLDVHVHAARLPAEASDGGNDGGDAFFRARWRAADLAVDRQLRRLGSERRRRRYVEHDAPTAQGGRERHSEDDAAAVGLE